MQILPLIIYELKTRFRLFPAWKAFIAIYGIGGLWVCWYAVLAITSVYSTTAAFLAPDGTSSSTRSSPSVFSPSAQYSWNVGTYHSGSGRVVATKEMTQGKASLYRERDTACAQSPCFKLVTMLKEATSYPLPTEAEIKAAFGNELGENMPHEMYGHSPYRRARDQILYHYRKTIFLGSFIDLTGFRSYGPDTPETMRLHVESFINTHGRQSATLKCAYKNEGNGRWQYTASYWYKSRPPGTEHSSIKSKFGEHHPLLQIFDPIETCPARYVER